MGFLKRLLGGGTTEVNLTLYDYRPTRPDAWLEVHGESYQQALLEPLAGPRGTHGVTNREHKAILVPEPDNPKDRNAIKVYLQTDPTAMSKAGYLPSTLAADWQAALRLISPATIRCDARLTGGWDRGGGDKGAIGVVLWLGKPIEFIAEHIAGRFPLRTDHKWSGKKVSFTGKSWCALCGVRLDKAAQEYLAARAGCTSAPRVSKNVDLCVTGDPAYPTAEVAKAQGYGVSVLPEALFWQAVGLTVTVPGPA